jgi:hypothetical protein
MYSSQLAAYHGWMYPSEQVPTPNPFEESKLQSEGRISPF